MNRIARSFLLLNSIWLALASASVGGEVPDHCRQRVPEHEAHGFVAFPTGNVFCPLIADPKSGHSFLSYQNERSTLFDTEFGAVGLADEFGIARWGGPHRGEGFQLGLEGGVYAQFDLSTKSYDLINADYVIGVPITWRLQGVSTRLRYYHQSSHLGDEFLLRESIPVDRENMSFESVEALLSIEGGGLRLYGGGEYLVRSEPSDLKSGIVHGGAEFRPTAHLVSLGAVSSVHFVAALDIKAAEQQDWRASFSGRAGLEFSRPHDGEARGRTWGLYFEYYDGPSPYGQFFRREMEFMGVGLHFMP